MYNGHRIVHYYHIYAQGLWKVPVYEHLVALTSSGLSEVIDSFNIGLVGSPEKRQEVIDYLIKEGCDFNIVAESDKGWEQETLDKLYEESLSAPPFKVIYAHSKGASNPSRASVAWRQDMTEGVVGMWKVAVELLDNHDAVGIFWIRAHKMFGGNFWWANSSHIATLGYPCKKDRFGAERWLRYVDGVDHISDSPIKVVDLHPGYRISAKRQVLKAKHPRMIEHMTIEPDFHVRVRFLRRIAGYKTGQIVSLPDSVFLRGIISGGSAAVLDPIDWTPEKAEEIAKKNKELKESKERNENDKSLPV